MKLTDKIQTAVFLLGAACIAYLSYDDPRKPQEDGSRRQMQRNMEMQASGRNEREPSNGYINAEYSSSAH